MRKVILEIDPSTISRHPFKEFLQDVLSKIEWIEGINLFNIKTEETSETVRPVKKAGVFKVKLKKGFEISDLIDPNMGTIELLEEEHGVIACFIKARIDVLPTQLVQAISFDNILISIPLYLSPTKLVVSFLGSAETVKAYLNLLKSFGISYKSTIQTPDQFRGDFWG